ncbi:MAG: hypothetical protein KDC35_12000 [Acidobacteria bacterium]|nr:hypothetical protein [Acidobacteriota bacterium]
MFAVGYYVGCTLDMKTAISIPDSVSEAADELADRVGLSRSALYGAGYACVPGTALIGRRHRETERSLCLNPNKSLRSLMDD